MLNFARVESPLGMGVGTAMLLCVVAIAHGDEAAERVASPSISSHTAEDSATNAAHGLRAPAGFSVSLFADDDLAHDIYSMTLDSQGRVVVAGRGYVKTLHDDDGDGRADRATLFSKTPASGAHGMCFDGPHLICTGDKSLMRLKDENGDGVADGEPEIWATLNHAEHGANGVTRGPDGAFYVACGNDAGVTAQLAGDARSPVQKPNCGAMLRFTADGLSSQILADGFRNPYDLDFNSAGQLFTVDADGERDQFLPWYTPTRLFDVALGMHHGWVLQGWQHSWNRPAAYFDNVPRLVEIGRGSPTGLVVYRHPAFPPAYFDSVFSCCWTLGRVYRFRLRPAGGSYESETEIFLETTGEVGFAPVDLAVGKLGELYVAIGGRGTRGGVFCVKYVGENLASPDFARPAEDLARVLSAPQPLVAWSRAQWLPLAQQLGAEAFMQAARDELRGEAERIRAVEVLTDVFAGLSPEAFRDLIRSGNVGLAARACWSLGVKPCEDAELLLQELAHDARPRLARAANEALLSLPLSQRVIALPIEFPNNHRLRSSVLAVIARQERFALDAFGDARFALEKLRVKHRRYGLDPADLLVAFQATDEKSSLAAKLEAIRLMQLALGDVPADPPVPIVFAGYTGREPVNDVAEAASIAEKLASWFPTGLADLDGELARLLAMLRCASPDLPAKLSSKWSLESRLEDDLHYLIALSLCTGERSEQVTKQTAEALANLHFKLAAGEMTPSRNWPQRVNEMLAELRMHDARLAEALVMEPRFRLPTQSLFALQLPTEQKLAAARKFLRHMTGDHPGEGLDDDRLEEVASRWTAELVELVALLPANEALPVLRDQWDDFLLRDDLALVLAKHAQAEDRQRLLEALNSVQPHVVAAVAKGLTRLSAGDNIDDEQGVELLSIFIALRQACLSPPHSQARQSLAQLLTAWTGQGFDPVEPMPNTAKPAEAEQVQAIQEGYAPWFAWFEKTYPRQAAKVTGFSDESSAAWAERLTRIDWDAADAARGKLVFEKRSCAKCHAGQNRLGPDLAGVAGRLSRGDLLAAIVDPSRDVSPLYQTTQIVTGAGKVYQGLVVYESPEGTLLQTTPDTTIRIAGEEILAMRKSRQSLMPTGLFNGATDEEVADLMAYLKTLARGK